MRAGRRPGSCDDLDRLAREPRHRSPVARLEQVGLHHPRAAAGDHLWDREIRAQVCSRHAAGRHVADARVWAGECPDRVDPAELLGREELHEVDALREDRLDLARRADAREHGHATTEDVVDDRVVRPWCHDELGASVDRGVGLLDREDGAGSEVQVREGGADEWQRLGRRGAPERDLGAREAALEERLREGERVVHLGDPDDGDDPEPVQPLAGCHVRVPRAVVWVAGEPQTGLRTCRSCRMM